MKCRVLQFLTLGSGRSMAGHEHELEGNSTRVRESNGSARCARVRRAGRAVPQVVNRTARLAFFTEAPASRLEALR
jgi:uracil-DNA glycosylase